jgi:hypothetical protein
MALPALVAGAGLASRGLASYLAKNKAKKERFISVRLDTFSLNEKNVAFYTKRGYSKLGDIYFPIKSKAPFHCFELPIIY